MSKVQDQMRALLGKYSGSKAAATQSSLKPSDTRSVLVIESKNPREVATGKGHVWWRDGAFRGPPVDPRQQGFRF